MTYRVLPDLILHASASFQNHGIGFIQSDGTTRFVSYPNFLKKSMAVLYGLQERGLAAGDRIILSLETSEETLTSLWAAFLGGIIPSVIQPSLSFSDYNPAADKAEKIFHILNDPYVIISHRYFTNWIEAKIPESNLVDFSWLTRSEGSPSFPDLIPDDLAMIQFSSGSTGDPKGVKLTHRNIISNIQDIIAGIRLTAEDVSVSWMPLYHDMGLIGFHITPALVGCQQYILDPVNFVKNPSLWLDNLSDRKCTITGCPNFGQALVNRYVTRKRNSTWDFSGIRVIFNGAEPISTRIMGLFLENLSPYGLQPVSMFPAYGLAEATLAVTFAPLDKEAEVRRFQRIPLLKDGLARDAGPDEDNFIELVNLGKHLLNCTIRILGDDGAEVPERTVGSVHVRGENVSAGYFKNNPATRQTFTDGWLHTGDLGFISEGNLFIVGRLKDVIFINGTNFYAHDLEHVALAVEGTAPGKLVIAAYFDEHEGRDKMLVFIVGSDSEPARILFARIKTHLMQTLGLGPDMFIPVKSSDIPRTSSGKIQRYKMVNRFQQGEFKVIRL